MCHIHSAVAACTALPPVEKACQDICKKYKSNNRYKKEREKILDELAKWSIKRPYDINPEIISLIEKNKKPIVAEALLHMKNVIRTVGGARSFAKLAIHARLLYTIVLLERGSKLKSKYIKGESRRFDEYVKTRLAKGGHAYEDFNTFLNILEISETTVLRKLSRDDNNPRYLFMLPYQIPSDTLKDINAVYSFSKYSNCIEKSEGEAGVKYRLKGVFLSRRFPLLRVGHVFYINREPNGTWNSYNTMSRDKRTELIPTEINGKASFASKKEILGHTIWEMVS